MHGKDTFSESSICLTIKIKKSLSKTLRKDYVFLNQWLVIWSNEWKKMVLLSW